MGQQKKEGSQHRSFLFRERGEKKSRDCYRTYDTFSFCDHYIRKHPHSTQHSVSFWKKRRLITLITLSARGGIAYHPPIPSVRKFSPSKSRAGWLANRKLDDVFFFSCAKDGPVRCHSPLLHGEAGPLGRPERLDDPPGCVAPLAGVGDPPGPAVIHKVAEGAAAVVRRRVLDSIMG